MTEQELIELWGDGSEFGMSPDMIGAQFLQFYDMNNAFREVAVKFALVVADKECVKGYNEGYGEGRYDGYEECKERWVALEELAQDSSTWAPDAL
jgi:hypothetical protein